MKTLVFAAGLLAWPAFAQDAAPAAQPSAAAAAVDPQRLESARPVVAAVFPQGSYARMMDKSMNDMMEGMVAAMLDMKAEDMVPGSGTGKPGEAAGKTLREVMAAEDPHFHERMTITNRVITEGLKPIMERMEPAIREGLTAAYARRFTPAQLAEMQRFFSTPTGRAYASESLMLWTDPEVIAGMQTFMPEAAKAMPAILDRVKAETAHLPVPKPRRGEKRRK